MNKVQKYNCFYWLLMFPKNKPKKLRQTRKDGIKEESHLNYAITLKYAFCFLVCLLFVR